MKFTSKIVVAGCLAAGLLLTSAYSEGSYNFEQKSSVEVSSSSGINYAASYKEGKSENGLFVYKIDDANLSDGKTEIYLSITNNGDRDTTLNEMTINFKATDEKGNLIRECGTHFNNLSINLPRNKEVHQIFVIEDPNFKKFDGNFDVNCDFIDVIIDPIVE